jgi:hypothetical protein
MAPPSRGTSFHCPAVKVIGVAVPSRVEVAQSQIWMANPLAKTPAFWGSEKAIRDATVPAWVNWYWIPTL